MDPNPSPAHQHLVAVLLTHLQQTQGHLIVNAAYEGYDYPQAHGRHQPDLVTRDSSGLLHLGEAKVGNDIFSTTTREQLLDFSSRVTTSTNSPVPLHVVVYKGDEQKLFSVLADLGLTSLVGTRIQVWTV